MSPDTFIEEAIAAGQKNDITALNPGQRMVFLISEAEVLCDMEGIDSFLDKYRPDWLPECANAFEEIGAVEVALALRSIRSDTLATDPLLDRLNDLITNRAGYDFEAIQRAVINRMSRHSSE